MHRLHHRTQAQQLQYHLDDGRAPDFSLGQPNRIDAARDYLQAIIDSAASPNPLKILELGCGAADITGPFAEEHHVTGVDIVPMAGEEVRRRWPSMSFYPADLESPRFEGSYLARETWDVIVMCETLEHLHDPIEFAARWLPRARYALIGHPLVGCGPDVEGGHIWGYNDDDFRAWWPLGGMTPVDAIEFGMGPYPRMVLGWGKR